MKKLQTEIKTGMAIFNNKSNLPGIVGMYKQGLITVSYKVSNTSAISLQYSTRAINSLIKSGEITIN